MTCTGRVLNELEVHNKYHFGEWTKEQCINYLHAHYSFSNKMCKQIISYWQITKAQKELIKQNQNRDKLLWFGFWILVSLLLWYVSIVFIN